MAEAMCDYAAKVLPLLRQAEGEIQIFPHAKVDGDCLGTACALAMTLRKLGCTSKVILECEIPQRLAFMGIPEDVLTIVTSENANEVLASQAVAFAVDCSEGSRMGAAEPVFEGASCKVIVDHHVSAEVKSDYAYIDGTSISCAELMAALIFEWENMLHEKLMDQFIADCLMVGIQSDSGKFSYENTKPNTFRIAASLMERGANVTDNAYHLFDETCEGKVRLHGLALSGMQLFADGRIAITKITKVMIDETSAPEGAADGIVNTLRDIDTVMAAFVVRENGQGELRVNCRTKVGFDAADFAKKMGGGGHHRAAGFTGRNIDIDTFADQIVKEAKAYLEQA